MDNYLVYERGDVYITKERGVYLVWKNEKPVKHFVLNNPGTLAERSKIIDYARDLADGILKTDANP